jgi:hypothetical protein
MKELLLQIAGVKTEAAFYKKFPTKAAFFKAHPEAKAIMAQHQKEMDEAMAENANEQMTGGVEESAEKMFNGGGIDNPGFKALPKSVQENIIANMAMGGDVEQMADGGIPQRYKNMGFTHVGQKKQGDGKHKWKVLAKKGDSYKVVQGGWKGMEDFKQHHSEKRRDNFWSRMGGKNSAKANDPFSPLYWHKRLGTWANGGIVPEMQDLILTGDNIYNMGGMVQYPSNMAMGGMLGGSLQEDEMYGTPSQYVNDESMFANGGGIYINPDNKGKFTSWAKKRGMSVQEAARKVMANKNKYTADVVKMANFARNAATWKKADGGELDVFSAFTNKVPVQTETYGGQPEQVVLPNGMIESVDAKTSHENMSDNEITDVLPQGSHIQSSRNKLTADQYANLMQMFAPETADRDIKMLEQVYKAKYGNKKNKELSPSDITEYAKKTYQRTPTPNNFDTEKLVTGNKKSFVDLGMTMNDLIKTGKEVAMEGMAYGGMVNKYADGTDTGMGNMNPFLAQNADYFNKNTSLTTPEAWDLLKGAVTITPEGKKNRIYIPENLPLEQKLAIEKAAENYDLKNLTQGYTKGYGNKFSAGLGGKDFEDKIALYTLGQEGYNKIKNDPKKVREAAFTQLGLPVTKDILAASDEKLYNDPKFYNAFRKSFESTVPENYRPFFGNTGPMGLDYWNAIMSKTPEAVNTPDAPVVTPEEKTVRYGNMGNYNVQGINPVQEKARSRYYSGLLEGQLGRGLSANEAELQAYLSNNPLYQMETPDTYIRSRKNEIPIGNILYNIEKTQRNTANALANQTGDWSTLAGNIANQSALAMNQVGDTLSALNQQNINLYNQTQGLQQNLLEGNMGIRNWNLYNRDKLANEKRNLFGQKAVKDAEMYSNYVKKMSENQQKEQQDKLALLSTMGAYPEMFKGGPGQQVSNNILNTYGSYNNPYSGTLLDYLINKKS